MSPHTRLTIIASIFLVLIAGGFAWHYFSSSSGAQMLPKAVLKINDVSVVVDVATSEAEHEKGLSGRKSLSPNNGMLFIFPVAGRYGFWMPDMHFSIDIIWLDGHLNVVHIEKNVTPESYPTVFTPEENATYVLEVVSGFAEEHQIKVGDSATFTFAAE